MRRQLQRRSCILSREQRSISSLDDGGTIQLYWEHLDPKKTAGLSELSEEQIWCEVDPLAGPYGICVSPLSPTSWRRCLALLAPRTRAAVSWRDGWLAEEGQSDDGISERDQDWRLQAHTLFCKGSLGDCTGT